MTDSHGPDDVTRLTDPTVMRAQTRIGQVIKEKWRLDVLLGVGGHMQELRRVRSGAMSENVRREPVP